MLRCFVHQAKNLVWPFTGRNDPQGPDISNLWGFLLLFAAVLPFSLSLSHLLSAVMIIIGVLMFIQDRKILSANGLLLPFAVLILTYLLASIFSPEPQVSIVIMKKLTPFLLLFLLPAFRLTQQSKQNLLMLWLGVTLIHSLLVAGQYLAGQIRPGGTFGYMFFGHFICIPLSVCMVMLWSKISKSFKYFTAITLIIGSIALFATMTRGAWIAFLAGTVMFLIIKKQWAIIICGLLLMSIAAGVAVNRFPKSKPAQAIQSIIHPLDNSNRRTAISNASRILMWQAAIGMAKDRPLFGVGPWRFRSEVRNYVPDPATKADIDHDHAHSIYFDALGTMGIVGFAALLYFLGSLFYVLIRQYRFAPAGLDKTFLLGSIMVMVCFCVGGLTEQCFHRAQSTLNLCFIIGLSLGCTGQADSEVKN